jgi:hypothetical protein
MSSGKAGRPTRADLAERERMKAKAAADDHFREWMETKIARGEVESLSWNEAVYRYGDPADDMAEVLITRPLPRTVMSPVIQWLANKFMFKTSKSTDGDLFKSTRPTEDEVIAALLDLLASDVRLDRTDVQSVAKWIVDMRRHTPEERRLDEDRAFIDWAAMMKEQLGKRGLTMKQAEEEVAKARGWKRETLHRNLRLARRRLRAAAK